MDQLIIAERALGARDIFQRIEGGPERGRKRGEVCFLGHNVRADQHAIGA